MIWGIFVWKKGSEIDENGAANVKAQKLSATMWCVLSIGTLIATFAVGLFLNSIGNAQAYTDAATNVLAVVAQLLMVKRYREQWVWWLFVDLLCLKLWFVAGNWTMFAMYIAWTINCIYGWVNWSKLNKSQNNLQKTNV
jgi:nicotinamide mononucleotide transporter